MSKPEDSTMLSVDNEMQEILPEISDITVRSGSTKPRKSPIPTQSISFPPTNLRCGTLCLHLQLNGSLLPPEQGLSSSSPPSSFKKILFLNPFFGYILLSWFGCHLIIFFPQENRSRHSVKCRKTFAGLETFWYCDCWVRDFHLFCMPW